MLSAKFVSNNFSNAYWEAGAVIIAESENWV